MACRRAWAFLVGGAFIGLASTDAGPTKFDDWVDLRLTNRRSRLGTD